LPHPESQINAGNYRIASLEEKLRDANEDCHFVRNQLFDTEIARRNEARVAFQRRLRLEQALYLDCSRAYRETTTRLDTTNTLTGILQEESEMLRQVNETPRQEMEMWRQDFEHGQHNVWL
jgi:hypothetical protein